MLHLRIPEGLVSTNFYGFIRHYYGGSGAYWREKFHLGQRAGGWEFLFQADYDRKIDGIQAWLRQLDTFDGIVDEYGNEYTVDDFLDEVECLRGKRPREGSGKYGSAWARSREFLDEDCFFAYYEFS